VRKLALIGAVAALWLFVAAATAFADGGPHSMATNNGTAGLNADSCAGCHRAHTADAANLLNSEQPDICLNCHDGTKATTDVVDGVQYNSIGGGSVLGALRGGGFQYALIASSSAARLSYTSGTAVRNIGHVQSLASGAPITSTHGGVSGIYGQYWGYSVRAFGNGAVGSGTGAIVDLECGSCHNPHGNGQYRVLQTAPSLTAVSGTFTVANSGGVFVQDTTALGTHNYTIRPASDGANAGGSASNVVANTSGDYWRYKWDPTGATIWTTSSLVADQMNTGWTSKTQSYTSTSSAGVVSTNYSFRYPVNTSEIPAYNTALQAAGRTTDPITGAALPLPVAQSSLSNKGGLMTAWCVQCHTRYDGVSTVTGSSPTQSLSASSLTANSADTDFMFKHGTTRIGCEQCHVSHGSNALMTSGNSLNFTNPDGVVPPKVTNSGITSGDSRLLKVDNRGTCQLCHDPTGTVTAGTYIGPVPMPGN
jgi:predicted CXXCH cytochrome family protein